MEIKLKNMAQPREKNGWLCKTYTLPVYNCILAFFVFFFFCISFKKTTHSNAKIFRYKTLLCSEKAEKRIAENILQKQKKAIPAAYLFQLSSLTYGNYKSWPETLASNKNNTKTTKTTTTTIIIIK